METEDVSSTSEVKETISWPPEDLKTLLNVIQSYVPPNDTTNYIRSVKRIPWNEVAFKKYSSTECEKVWNSILKNVRHHRLLNEILMDALDWVDCPWTNFYASKDKNRHPDLPKRPAPPLLLFLKDFKHIKKDYPDMKSFRNKIQEMYENLSEKEKKKYHTQFELNKEEYDRKAKIFLLNNPEYKNLLGKRYLLKEEQINSALQVYIKEQINNVSKHDSEPTKDLIATFKNQWENLSTTEKMSWFQKSKNKNRKMKENNITTTVSKPKLKLPARSVYSVFSKKMLNSSEIKTIPTKERMSKIALWYKALKPNQIDQLKVEMEEGIQKYMKQLATENSELAGKLKKSRKGKKEKKDEDLKFGDISEINVDNYSPGKEDEEIIEPIDISSQIKTESSPPEKSSPKKKKKKDKTVTEVQFTLIPELDSEKNTSMSKKKKPNKDTSFSEREITNSEILNKNDMSVDSSFKRKEKRKIAAISNENEIPVDESVLRKKKKKNKNISDVPSTLIPELDNETNTSMSKKKKLNKVVSFSERDETNSEILNKNDVLINSSFKGNERRKIAAISMSDVSNENEVTVDASLDTGIRKKKRKLLNSETTESENNQLELSITNLYPGEPVLPPSTPFEVFALEKKKNNKKKYSADKLLEQWSNLDSVIQKGYKKSLKQVKKQYIEDYEKFMSSLSKNDLRKYLKKKGMEQS